jgi:DNA replication protein DnaC
VVPIEIANPRWRTDDDGRQRESVIKQQCVVLRVPTIAGQCVPLAEQAERERQPYLSYLEALLAAELEDRERRAIDRPIKEAHMPRVMTLDEFDFRAAPTVSPAQLSKLAAGGYLERAQPIVFIGDWGTGKTHPLTALCVAARQRKRVRFTTAAALVDGLWKPNSSSNCGACWAAGRANRFRRTLEQRQRSHRRGPDEAVV